MSLAADKITRHPVHEFPEWLGVFAEMRADQRGLANAKKGILPEPWLDALFDKERPIGQRLRRVDHEGVALRPVMQCCPRQARDAERGQGAPAR